ncbi:M48 family metallopeptidase [Grimontia marina]|uniref:Metalloprotease LoiP n=1 Tax=Grimontia marina TaxID=646534 RepID=A0A128FD52_9GAMM|nr:M48 family metallopeptidase [Grimontia marina]CZF84729.1 Metalloprotease LoiP precursor [Grimontia marina]
MVKGIAFAAGESGKHQAELFVIGETKAILTFDDKTVECRLDEVSRSERIGNLPLQLSFPDGELFLPDNEADLPYCFQVKSRGWLTRLESSKTAILSSIAAALLFMAAFFSIGLPGISTGITQVLPEEIPMAVGEHVMSQLDERMFTASELDTERQQALNQRFDELMKMLPQMPVNPRLVFRNWKQGPNAFALSDGTVVLLDPLVNLAQTDAQLESVILHELGHVYHQHVMKGLVRSTLISVSIAVITGESTGVIDLMTGLGVLAATAGYSRADEEESDQFAAKYLSTIYGDASAQAEMFALLGEAHQTEGMSQWLSSHPDTESRIEAANSFQTE